MQNFEQLFMRLFSVYGSGEKFQNNEAVHQPVCVIDDVAKLTQEVSLCEQLKFTMFFFVHDDGAVAHEVKCRTELRLAAARTFDDHAYSSEIPRVQRENATAFAVFHAAQYYGVRFDDHRANKIYVTFRAA